MPLDAITPVASGEPRESWRVLLPMVAALALAYVATGWVGLGFAFYQENVTLIWPPTGLCLAALIVWGPRLWMGVWLGAFALSVLNGSALSISLGFATGNALMSVVGARLLVRFFDFRPSLTRVRDVMALVFIGGGVAATISATIGATTLWLHGDIPASNFDTVLSIWWRGDLGGVVAVAPFFLVLGQDRAIWRSLLRESEFWIVAAVGAVFLTLAYSGVIAQEWERIAVRLIFPLLFWAAIRLGTPSTVLLNSIALLVSVLATTSGLGPMASGQTYPTDGILWIFYVVAGFTSLTLAAAVSERKTAEAAHSQEAVENMRVEREKLVSMERDRIMREMHDGIGAQLTSILSMVQRGRATNDEISEALRRTLDDMRLMIDPFGARDVGFPEMLGRLRARLDPVLRRNGLHAVWNIEALEALERFDPKQSLHALRIIQEAIANVVQHARATRVEIRISAADASAQSIAIEISDNGIGEAAGGTLGGHGTLNMNARAQALGGELRLESGDSGRTVRLLIPVSSLG